MHTRIDFRIMLLQRNKTRCYESAFWPKLLGALLALAAAAIVCLPNLDSHSLDVVDEGRHVLATQSLLKTDLPLSPTLYGAPYFHKPPLKMWLSLIPVKVLGESEFSYRIIDSLFGIAIVVATYYLALLLFSSVFCGNLAALALCGCYALFHIHGVRNAVQDSALIFFCTLQFVFIWKIIVESDSYRSSRKVAINDLLLATSIAAALLCKSVFGFLPSFL